MLIIGVGLAVAFFSQDEKLDETVFLQTTESIRNLQASDKNLSVMLNQSQLDPGFEHESLWELYYQISEEFDNLRYEALFEEIEQSESLSAAVAGFEAEFGSEEALLESYVTSNSKLGASILAVQQLTDGLQTNQELNDEIDLVGSFAENKSILLQLALGETTVDNLAVIPAGVDLSADVAERLASYHQAVETINREKSGMRQAYAALSALDTGELLDQIESEYVDYHTQAIGGSEAFTSALIAYGVLLFTTLLFFGYQIRKNYLSLEQQVADRTLEIETAYRDLQESQEQLIQSEKMASLGQMVAGVAHEINTPLGYVTSNVDTLKLNLLDINSVINKLENLFVTVSRKDRDKKEVSAQLVDTLKAYRDSETAEVISESSQLLTDGAFGLSEIAKLVGSLKDFARLDRQDSDNEDVHTCVENSLTIASHQLRANKVQVEKQFSELPKISCRPSKLNQVFLNIITNACQAIGEEGGHLTINTSRYEDHITVAFTDDGAGMDDETQQKMFDPFYTSKEIGQGTGLGMSIAYKIIEAHQGKITVESKLGVGTTISVTLPVTVAA